MSRFREVSLRSNALSFLASITLTMPPFDGLNLESWLLDVRELVRLSPLQKLHIYAAENTLVYIPDWFPAAIAEDHHSRLNRFSVHRAGISPASVALLCRRCTYLEQLFIVVERSNLVSAKTISPL
jgi:hypothetical protein